MSTPIELEGYAESISLSADGNILVVGEPTFGISVRVFQIEESKNIAEDDNWQLVETLYGRSVKGGFGLEVALSPNAEHLAVFEFRMVVVGGVHVYVKNEGLYQ